MKVLILLLSGFALISHAGQVTKPASKLAAAMPDAAIEAAIRARLAKSKIAKNGFEVRVQNGVATLTGRTDVVQHKGVATRLAKLGGAVRVNNRIEIEEAARTAASVRLAEGRKQHSAKKSERPAAAAAPGHKQEPTAPEDELMSGEQPPPPRPRRATLIKK